MKKIIFTVISFISLIQLVNAQTIEENLNQMSQTLQTIKNQTDSLNNKFPIGSIYITIKDQNPSEIVGGTWEKYAQGKTLLGTTENNSSETTGGNSSITLTSANLPSHTHTLTPTGSVTSTFTGKSTSTSSSGSHNHTMDIYVSIDEVKNYDLSISGGGFAGRVVVVSTKTSSTSSAGAHTHTLTPAGTITSKFTGTKSSTSSIGQGSSINIQNPYITVYIWKRVG